ncbi:MAG: hypothetical protein SFY81_13440 [Verrucomicrobiota bacterium]|nr:hypothetical protein [Verrucomicrobiota bacterium]
MTSLLFSSLLTFAAETFKVSDMTFNAPEKWKVVQLPPGGMRKAQLEVPSGEKKAEVVFFHFGPGGGGGVQANIDRWLGQFKEPKDQIKAQTEKVEANGKKVSYVQAEGTYLSGMPGGPKTEIPDAMLLGAIIESANGDVFIRMTGPKTVVSEAKAEFRKMVEGK